MPTMPAATLQAFCAEVFRAGGLPDEDAALVADSLVGANLRGHDSHGVIRVPQYLDAIAAGRLRADVPLTVLHETPAMLAADGHWGLGQVQAHRLLGRLLDKARSLGVAAGTLRQCGHTGRLGEYAERAAAEGMVLFATVNSHGSGPRVAPPGGTQGRLSTNPLCLGAPTSTAPLVLDIGTSVVAEGKVRVAFQKGEAIPEGWLIDAAGRPCTDPGVLYGEPRGALLPLGGTQAYKGFGLSLLLDVLAGGLSGGGCTRGDGPPPVGNAVFMMVLNVEAFVGRGAFEQESGRLASFVRSCPTAAGIAAITLPGDPERAALAERTRTGIALPAGTWQLLAAKAERLGVALPA